MDSQPSEARDTGVDLVARLQECARRGDWARAEILAMELQTRPPVNSAALGEYLESLRAALIVAKASRADTAASLARVRAAACFGSDAMEPPAPRQNFGDPAEI